MSFFQHSELQIEYYERSPTRAAMQVADTPYVHRHIERLKSIADLRQDDEILEVGAGLGKFSIPLIAEGYRLVCLDLSACMLESLRNAAPAPVEVVACDILEAPSKIKRQFTRIIGFFILHHLYDLDAAFRAVAEMLAPGGRAVFVEPNPAYPLYYFQIALTPGMRWAAEKGMLKMRTPVVHKAMRQAGLESQSTSHCGFFPPTITNQRWGGGMEDAIDRRMPAFIPRAFHIFSGLKKLRP